MMTALGLLKDVNNELLSMCDASNWDEDYKGEYFNGVNDTFEKLHEYAFDLQGRIKELPISASYDLQSQADYWKKFSEGQSEIIGKIIKEITYFETEDSYNDTTDLISEIKRFIGQNPSDYKFLEELSR